MLGSGLDRPRPSDTDPPGWLEWTSEPLAADLDIVGPSELVLDATTTAIDTAWIVTIQEVDADGHADDITAGYLRASLREVDRDASRPGAPVVPCRRAEAVPVGEAVRYRIPIVDTARRVPAGHSLRVVLTSDDQGEQNAIMGFRHATVGTSSLNRIEPTSHLLLPVVAPSYDGKPALPLRVQGRRRRLPYPHHAQALRPLGDVSAASNPRSWLDQGLVMSN